MNRGLFVLLIVLVALAGCSGRPRRVPVSGKVTIDGKPVTTGFIQFIPEKSRPAMSEIDAQGNYRLETYGEGDGCVLGTHRVTVLSMQTLSPLKIRWLAPQKYRDANTSGLTVDIDRPRDDVEIKLTWDGAKPFVEETRITQGDSDPTKVK